MSCPLCPIHFHLVSFGTKVPATPAPRLPRAAALVLLTGFATAGGLACHAPCGRRLEDRRKALPGGQAGRRGRAPGPGCPFSAGLV